MYLTSLLDNASAPEHEARSSIRRQFILDFILFEMFFTAMIRRESSCLGHNCGFHFSCARIIDVIFWMCYGFLSRNASKTVCYQCVTQCYSILLPYAKSCFVVNCGFFVSEGCRCPAREDTEFGFLHGED